MPAACPACGVILAKAAAAAGTVRPDGDAAEATLSGDGTTLPERLLQVPESVDPAPSGTEQGGFGIPGEAWAMAGVGLLLGLGSFAELRIFSRLY